MAHPALDLLRLAAELGATVTMPPDVARQVVEEVAPDTDEWCGVQRASAITRIPPGTLRSRAAHWALATAEGRKPAIRCRKKDPSNPRSHYEFHVGDCWRNQRADTPEPVRGTDGGERRRGHLRVADGGMKDLTPDQRQETIQHYVAWSRRLYEGA